MIFTKIVWEETRSWPQRKYLEYFSSSFNASNVLAYQKRTEAKVKFFFKAFFSILHALAEIVKEIFI